ncbi:MAG TPA: hypothetical protein VFX51_22050 [Solirubrobacteraceae bacterium]|nr:hypothetical protein [Solirubrobacteraceae bacterium]
MKVVVGLVLALALFAPSSAVAGEPVCDLGDGTVEIADEERIAHLLGELGASDDIRALLGDQAAGFWASPRDQAWDFGVAPGPLSVDEARAAIEDLLTKRFAADDVVFLMTKIKLYAMPYSDNEIYAIADELHERMVEEFGEEFVWVVDQGGCLDGEAWRVQVGLFSDATPDQIAAVRELIGPYGDIVRLYLDGLVDLPNAGGGTTAARLRSSFIKLRSPKRCVSARTIQLKTRKSARRVIRRITVTVNGKRRALTDNRLTIRIKRPVTAVRVVIRVGDGSRLAHTYRFRRC